MSPFDAIKNSMWGMIIQYSIWDHVIMPVLGPIHSLHSDLLLGGSRCSSSAWVSVTHKRDPDFCLLSGPACYHRRLGTKPVDRFTPHTLTDHTLKPMKHKSTELKGINRKFQNTSISKNKVIQQKLRMDIENMTWSTSWSNWHS